VSLLNSNLKQNINGAKLSLSTIAFLKKKIGCFFASLPFCFISLLPCFPLLIPCSFAPSTIFAILCLVTFHFVTPCFISFFSLLHYSFIHYSLLCFYGFHNFFAWLCPFSLLHVSLFLNFAAPFFIVLCFIVP